MTDVGGSRGVVGIGVSSTGMAEVEATGGAEVSREREGSGVGGRLEVLGGFLARGGEKRGDSTETSSTAFPFPLLCDSIEGISRGEGGSALTCGAPSPRMYSASWDAPPRKSAGAGAGGGAVGRRPMVTLSFWM